MLTEINAITPIVFSATSAISQLSWTHCVPAPRGGIPGLCPPKRGLCPEEINRLGASGVQIEAQISVCCGLTPAFVTFLGWRPFFFFLEIIFFFFGDHLFSAVKTAWISDFGRKIPLNLCSSPCSFHPDWDKFFVPPQNLFLPPQSRYPGAGPVKYLIFLSCSTLFLCHKLLSELIGMPSKSSLHDKNWFFSGARLHHDDRSSKELQGCVV